MQSKKRTPRDDAARRRRRSAVRVDRVRVASFQRRLLAWYARHGRDLPWRRTRDPYAILVSEIMLQQTQVRRVLEYYPRFLARYPTVADLAVASTPAVRESWDGLGYYRRAGNLRRAAQHVADRRGRTARLWTLAEATLPAGRAYEFNQAIMDLGALVCRARKPTCPVCPVRRACRAFERAAARQR